MFAWRFSPGPDRHGPAFAGMGLAMKRSRPAKAVRRQNRPRWSGTGMGNCRQALSRLALRRAVCPAVAWHQGVKTAAVQNAILESVLSCDV